ncbi:MAG: 2-hydroxychromene-2-carboxylate isomerase [Alphaproteobacteria bacterium]|nr:2-hydroxychromene-2-carboxylate isomerase [Alphaproteobacteria bacterium]MBN9500079.1 2-hydroxychromene-2-carboxylate isomerase [Alphaproteobacteria bacterium]
MTAKTIDYYFTPLSPWAYLGHERFVAIAKRHNAHIEVKPVDYGRVFPVSGGLPLAQRPKQRQAYRLMELQRWREHLALPLILTPKNRPTSAELPSRLVIAADMKELNAMALSLAIHRAIWVEDRDISDPETLKAICAENGRKPDFLWEAEQNEETKRRYDSYTQEAIDRQVFGAPTYVYKDELFWGQDRLDFLDRALAKG